MTKKNSGSAGRGWHGSKTSITAFYSCVHVARRGLHDRLARMYPTACRAGILSRNAEGKRTTQTFGTINDALSIRRRRRLRRQNQVGGSTRRRERRSLYLDCQLSTGDSGLG